MKASAKKKLNHKLQIKFSKPFWQAIALGILTGMRTTAAPAIASHILNRQQPEKLDGTIFKFMKLDNVALAAKLLACGELVGDKLPQAPNRIKPAGVIGRCIAGSLGGAAIYKATGNYALTGALLGSVAALGATFGSYYLRRFIVDKSGIFDPLIGAVEDAVVIGAGAGLIMAS